MQISLRTSEGAATMTSVWWNTEHFTPPADISHISTDQQYHQTQYTKYCFRKAVRFTKHFKKYLCNFLLQLLQLFSFSFTLFHQLHGSSSLAGCSFVLRHGLKVSNPAELYAISRNSPAEKIINRPNNNKQYGDIQQTLMYFQFRVNL